MTCQKQASTPMKKTRRMKIFRYGEARKISCTTGKISTASAMASPSTISIMTICRTGWENCGSAV